MSRSHSNALSITKIFGKSDFAGKTALVLSTWFGTGLFPVVPGTFGSLAAVPLILVSQNLGVWYSAPILVILVGAGIWASDRSQDLLGRDDPKQVVIDEVAGFFLTMLFLPSSWLALGLGFFLFRFFDILKPFPVKQAERLKGGLGIIMDDLLAGLYAFGSAKIILLII
jgi:phosphatidylglycerophosphatase A